MENIETGASTKNIDAAILRIQTEAPVIRKKADNPYFKSKYAEYPEIQAEIRPLLIKEGIITMFFPIANNQLVMNVKHTSSNEFYKITMDLKTIQDSPQAQGSAITYGKRYMFTAFFDLQIEDASDDDGNGASIPKQPTQQPEAGNNNQSAPPAAKPLDPNRPYLNPNTETWFNTKVWFFTTEKASLEKVVKKYRITKVNQELLIKQEDLKPGSKLWIFATAYLAKEGAKTEPITKAFNITESDLTDLQIDATITNYVAPQTEGENNAI